MRTLSAILLLAFSAPAIAQGSTSQIEQIGTGHRIEVTQIPELGIPATLVSLIRQTGADQTAKVLQRGLGDDAHLTITQHGNENVSEVAQGSSGGGFFDAIVLQDGQQNTAKVTQMDFGGDNTAGVTQLGSGHFAEVTQSGGFATTVASILELGTGHIARITHGGWNGIHHATIHLEGVENEATITQGYIEAAINNADVWAVGSANEAIIIQSAENSTSATVHQEGGLNTARTEQLYSSIAVSSLSQLGDMNSAIVLQSGALGRGENRSAVTQEGTGNIAEVRQFTVDIFTETDNHSAVSQHGNFNAVTVTQQGASNNSTVSVTGNNNMVNVKQQ